MAYAQRESLLMKKRGTSTSTYAECDDDGNLHVTIGTAKDNVAGSINTTDIQSGALVAEGMVVFPAGSPADTVRTTTILKPDIDPMPKNFVFYMTSTTQTQYQFSLRNTTSISGIPLSSQIGTQAPPIPAQAVPDGTAWSSCFTSIGGSLTDESGDWNDAGVGDVPFNFTAQNDAIYFGHTAPFRSVQWVASAVATWDGLCEFEYWNGSVWAPLTITTKYPAANARPFQHTTEVWGWNMPDNWSLVDPDGSPLQEYWMRIRITSILSKTGSPALNTGLYTLAKSPMSYAYSVSNLFNAGPMQIVFSNIVQANVNGDTPILWQLRVA